MEHRSQSLDLRSAGGPAGTRIAGEAMDVLQRDHAELPAADPSARCLHHAGALTQHTCQRPPLPVGLLTAWLLLWWRQRVPLSSEC